MKPCIGKKEYNRFMDDSLSDEQIAGIEAHLKSCGQCKKEFENWKEIKALISASMVKVPESLKTKVMSRIREESIIPGAAPLPLNRTIVAVFLIIILGFYFNSIRVLFRKSYLWMPLLTFGSFSII
jgi:anti-sigma factor RsiW